ncbi:MAG: GntR family transcriptional regulator [Lachnospiraceae bacterium]|nr:GntR family transcriptional regulator [Lachnospiraceae bacterium]
MHIILNNSSMIPIYEQLMEQIKSEIICGNLKEGDALPSVRSMAAEMRISALTVKKAYDKLEQENYIVTVHGKGSFVAATDTGLAAEARRSAAEEKLSEALDAVKASGMTKEEIYDLISILLEDPS